MVFTGWGVGKNERPFSREEFNKSKVRKSFDMDYPEYLRTKARIEAKKTRTTKKKVMPKPRRQTYRDPVASFLGRY